MQKKPRQSRNKGRITKRNKLVRELVREIVGFSPYERRAMELLRIRQASFSFSFYYELTRFLSAKIRRRWSFWNGVLVHINEHLGNAKNYKLCWCRCVNIVRNINRVISSIVGLVDVSCSLLFCWSLCANEIFLDSGVFFELFVSVSVATWHHVTFLWVKCHFRFWPTCLFSYLPVSFTKCSTQKCNLHASLGV